MLRFLLHNLFWLLSDEIIILVQGNLRVMSDDARDTLLFVATGCWCDFGPRIAGRDRVHLDVSMRRYS